jgi:hypothetical protein
VSLGQTKNELEKKYGSEKYYKIRPHTLISPKFDKFGQLCLLEIKPNPFPETVLKPENVDIWESPLIYSNSDTHHLFPIFILNSTELKEVFNELVPLKTRRGRGNSSIDISGFGGSYVASYQFENIMVRANVVPTEKRAIDARGYGENLDLFFNIPFGKISSAQIIWKDTSCGE